MKDWCLLLLITAPRILCTSRGIFIDDPDAPFYVTATRSGLPEEEGGGLAQQRSNIQQVRDFATMVVSNHVAANTQLHELSMANSCRLADGAHREAGAQEGAAGDVERRGVRRSSIEWQILAHRDASTFRRESESGRG